MKIFVILILLIASISWMFIDIYLEKKKYNGGICKMCGRKLRFFSHSPHGGRGYCCNKCHSYMWVHYNCVDKSKGGI